MTLPYSVDAAGCLDFPGTAGNFASISRPALSTFATSIQITARVRVDSISVVSVLGGWGTTQTYMQINTNRTMTIRAVSTTATVIGAAASPVMPTTVTAGVDFWVRGKLNLSTAVCDYWYSLDNVISNPTWIALTPSPTGTNPGASPVLTGSDLVTLGTATPTGVSVMNGQMYYFSEEIDGVEMVRFDGSVDLAGVLSTVAVPPDPFTTFVPSIPNTSLVTVHTVVSAADQGYVTFPGTVGNYLSVADVGALDFTGASTFVWRERVRDMTPTHLGQTVLAKVAAPNQFSYRITHGPRDFIFGRSNNGTAITNNHIGSDDVPFALNHSERWIWWCLTFDVVPTNGTTRLWYSEDDSLTPPVAARWTAVPAVTDAAAKTIFAGSAPLLIGPSLDGDIGYLSLRIGGASTVLGGSEQWRFDANSLVGLEPNAPTITPVVGGAATVVYTPTPKDTGYIEFPGTPGNYLGMSDAVGDLFTDTISFYAKIARDDNWLPPDPETIVAKWGDPGQCSYLWSINDGYLEFRWTINGTLDYGIGSSIPVPDPGVGVPMYIGMSTTRAAAVRTVNFWTSPDAVTWSPLGTAPTYTQPTATAIFNSTTPLTIGSAAAIKSRVSNLHPFTGRILEVAGSTGVDGFFGGFTDTVETFRIGSEHLTDADLTTFPATGGNVDVHSTPYPDDFGIWRFPGTKGNFLMVPDATNLRLTDSFCAEVRIAPNDWTPQDTDRVLMRKTGTTAGNYGWQFLLTPRGTLKMLTSADGTVLDSAESTLPVPVAAGYSKRVAVTYVSGDYVRFWLSDNGIDWDKLGADVSPSGVLHASTAPLQIGVTYWGALTDASLRDEVGPVGEPILGTEVFLMDQGCLNIDPHPPNFVATTGQTVTVTTDDVSLDRAEHGWIDFPGTAGNYLDTPNHVDFNPYGDLTIIIRMAPNDWTRTGKTQTIVGKWSTAGNLSWLLQLLPNANFRFTWTVDGTVTSFLDSGQMASFVDGEFRMFAFTVDKDTTTTLRRWESTDFGQSWTLRNTASTTFGVGAMYPGTAPVTIGANNNTEHFEGRISSMEIRNGIGAGGAPGGTRALWWSAESLHLTDPSPTSFVEETGKTITIHKANTPTTPGSIVFYGQTGDFASTTVPTLASTTGMTMVTRLDRSDTRPAMDRLAAGVASPTQTPRPNITGDVFISSYLAVVAGTADQTLCGAWWAQNEVAWRLYIDGFTGGLRFNWTEDGANPVWTSPVDLITKAQLTALGTGLVFLGLQIERNILGHSLFTVMNSIDLGLTWTPVGTAKQGPVMNDTWPGTDPTKLDSSWRVRLTVGGEQIRDLTKATDDQTVTNASWRGQIQWVQMTQFPSDTLMWRFDPNDYPGTGLTFTDPRLRQWRLDNETAIGQFPPLDPPEVQVIAQRWDETTKCCFSLRSASGGFTFSTSEDGTPTSGGELEIPISDEEWHPGTEAGNWGWLAVTQRIVGTNSLFRIFHAVDNGTGVVPTTWVEIDTQVTATDVSALFVSTTEPFTIGAGKDGKLPFIGKVGHMSLRDGTGTNGVVGGTERFRIDMASLHGVAADAPTFPAGTSQVVSMLPDTETRLAIVSPTPDGLPCLLDGPNPAYPGSPPGPTLYLDPAPPGPLLSIEPSTVGAMTVITPSPAAPTLELVSPSLDRTWWPGQTADNVEDPTQWWTQPAFTVQRLLNGPGEATGGDYVRGSANVLTEQTALRFPTSTIEGLSSEGLGKGILFASPHPESPYDTVLIEWNFPADLTAKGHVDTINNAALDPWLQVAIVRSAFGAPTTVNDGQTIFLATRSALYPKVTKAGVTTQPYKVDVDNLILTEDAFDPRVPRSSDDDHVPRLPSGRWYYYSLFFLVDTHWYRAASDHVLLPRNHHHADHLWNALPPYYRWADEQEAHGNPGHLQKFLTVFGYDLDLTREYIESWQNMYSTDFAPMSLLKRIGETFGLPYESTVGDIRYRAMIAKIGFLYIGRGTSGTLRKYVAAASKCDCDVVTSPNIMLLPDDSDFSAGTGNWAGLHTGTTISGSGIPAVGARLTPDQIRLDYGTRSRPSVPADLGRGSMHVWSSKVDATSPFIITCGDGERYAYDTGPASDTDPTNDTLIPPGQPDSLFPRFHGIHVKPGQIVSFSIYACADPEAVNTIVQPMLMFFSKDGQADDLLSYDISGLPIALSLALDAVSGEPKWYQLFNDAPVPEDTVYCVPALIVTSRPAGTHATLSPMVHFAGGMFVVQGDLATISSDDPATQMLTLDQTGELIGATDPSAPSFIDSKLGEER